MSSTTVDLLQSFIDLCKKNWKTVYTNLLISELKTSLMQDGNLSYWTQN